MSVAVYDTIGEFYDVTRKADPGIVKKLIELLNVKPKQHFLDIGCGSGNYTHALSAQKLNMTGLDVSSAMIAKAKSKAAAPEFLIGDARKNPFPDGHFDGATCILATHHIPNCEQAFQEAYRVITQGQLVIFTIIPEQMKHYWLCHYFPKLMQDAMQKMTNYEKLEHDLLQAGFNTVQKHPFFITNQLEDRFLYAGKYRPEIYLDPAIRAGISSFHLSVVDQAELDSGLTQLEKDISSGAINDIINRYETDSGDCLFVSAEKH